MSHYKISLEETEKVTTMEYYGKQFPVHPEEWEQYHSFWQEDYANFLLQKDIGLLTIYYEKKICLVCGKGALHPCMTFIRNSIPQARLLVMT
nr:hypothetical protein [Streptococcus agalactiae]